MALLPESGGACGVLLAPVAEVASRATEARTGIHSKQMPGPAAPALLGQGVAGRPAILERGSGPALRLQEALHEGRVVWVPPRVLRGARGAHPRALGGLHLFSQEDIFLRGPRGDRLQEIRWHWG